MSGQPLRPIGTEYETVTETPTERVVTVWRVDARVTIAGGEIELAAKVSETRQPKTFAPSERKADG